MGHPGKVLLLLYIVCAPSYFRNLAFLMHASDGDIEIVFRHMGQMSMNLSRGKGLARIGLQDAQNLLARWPKGRINIIMNCYWHRAFSLSLSNYV